MVRPKAKQLTERELEIMHVFWPSGAKQQAAKFTAAEVRQRLADEGRELGVYDGGDAASYLAGKGIHPAA